VVLARKLGVPVVSDLSEACSGSCSVNVGGSHMKFGRARIRTRPTASTLATCPNTSV
jgi:hypothetical protein